MAWVPVAVPNFQQMVLPLQMWLFVHALHGALRITRLPKQAGTNQINYQLQLTHNGVVTNETCHLTVTNYDTTVMAPFQLPPNTATSSVGYGMIDISNMSGKSIIYLLHHVFCTTGMALGVSWFVVESIVNPDAMNPICVNCGMGAANLQNAYQGACAAVRQQALLRAVQRGWH